MLHYLSNILSVTPSNSVQTPVLPIVILSNIENLKLLINVVLIICVDTGIDDGYWKGEVDGKQGMFPSMLVEEVDTAENNQELPPPSDTQQDHQQQPNQVI